jgi:two-component system sensor histidine kinase BaeS
MRPPRISLRHSLLTRLLTTSILVAACATLVTAWLVTRTTTHAIREERGRSLAEEKRVYDELLGYAATHDSWSGVEPLVRRQAARLDRRITLLTKDQQIIADSGPAAPLHANRPASTIDPLHVDTALTGGELRIDPRAVGPYSLPAADRDELKQAADTQVACMSKLGFRADVTVTASGRPIVRLISADVKDETAPCRETLLALPISAEEKPLAELTRNVNRCLHLRRNQTIVILPDFSVYAHGSNASNARIRHCVDLARRAQLTPYVAPPAQLFVTDPSKHDTEPGFELSPVNLGRIAASTGIVLLVAVVVTVLAGRRLVRPLRALTRAAQQPIGQQHAVSVRAHDEIGHLARALSDLNERRQRAEQQRTQLVADVAHELRTPLTVIRSRIEAAEDGLTPLDRDLLHVLRDETLLLHHIIDDLRDLVAADSGTLRIYPEATWIDNTLQQVVEAHRYAAENDGIRLHYIPGTDAALLLDPVRLRQLIGNLVTNAIRYTPRPGDVTITSALTDETLTITVTDTGVGIAPDDLPKIFDRFWRADASRNRDTGGSGLGLTIARKITETHGGRLTVTSRVGVGSTFTVEIPAQHTGA